MRKALAGILSLVLILALFAACSGGNESTPASGSSESSTDSSSAASGDTSTPAESTPAESGGGEGGEKLVVALASNNFVTDYDNNYFTQYLEELLGIDIEFYMLPSDATEIRTKISLMVATSDSMPDVIIVDNSLTQEAILDYGSKGAFISLSDYLADPAKTPNFNAVAPEDKEIMLSAITSADGNIYCLPKYEPETWNLTPNRLYMNSVWLEKVGKSVPATTDELYDVLVAFRDGDPNGNGAQDEIGVYGFFEGGYGENVIWSLMNSFVFYNGGNQNGGLALDEAGNTVIAPFATDEWKEGLAYLNKLYSEQLLAASLFTDDQTQFRAVLNNEVNIVGITSAGSTGNWPDADNNANFQEMDIIAPLSGPQGVRYTPYSLYSPSRNFFITSNCKNPDLAIKLGDAFLDKEVGLVARFGEEGVDWTRDAEELKKTSNTFVEAGLYSELTMGNTTNIWAEPSTKTWHNINPRYATLDMGNTVGNLFAPYNPELKTAMLGAFSYEHYYPAHPENVLPLLGYTVEEALATSEPITNITEYVKQATAEFVTGARDVDSGWDAYIKDMENMGLATWLENAQAAYERSK
ncbi:MAG: hypothetical protein ACK5LX_09260 [Oscillospiraceae bacterium]